MACRNNISNQTRVPTMSGTAVDETLYFGVDSIMSANTVLQNNLTMHEWVTRNKIDPNFWGRYITGENALTPQEIQFIHRSGCKIAAIFGDIDLDQTETGEQGTVAEQKALKTDEEKGTSDAQKALDAAAKLSIPIGNAIFLEVNASVDVTTDYLKGFAKALVQRGYTPGFIANTDSHFDFSRRLCRGYRNEPELFNQCLLWAVSPTLQEYDGTTDSHLIYPDVWSPHVPSCLKRSKVAIWQYGGQCHPIEDNAGNHHVQYSSRQGCVCAH